MSVIADPQALYGRLIDKGVDSALATEASVNDLRGELRDESSALREETRQLREEMRQGFAAMREDIIKTNARIDLLPKALLIRLGSLMVVLAGLIVTAQRLWPAH